MEKQYRVVIIGFSHMHINDVAAHFYENPRIWNFAAQILKSQKFMRITGKCWTRKNRISR